MVSIVISVSERLDKFLNQDCTLHEIIFDFYLNFIPWINGQLWPLFALISVIFFTSRLANDSEIVAILSSGVSFKRLMVPYLISSCLLAAMFWYGKNYLIPRSTKVKNEFESKYFSKLQKQTLSNNVHFYVNPNEKVYIRYYKERDSTAYSFRLERFKEGNLVYILKSPKLKLKETPNVWTMQGYEERYFTGTSESFNLQKETHIDTALNFTPDDFVRHTKQMEMMTTSDLKDFIEIEKSRGLGSAKQFVTELQSRNASPFTLIILTMIGFALSSRKIRGGMGLNLAIGVVLGSLYVVLAQFSLVFANTLFSDSSIGVWIPNIIFSTVAVFLLFRASG